MIKLVPGHSIFSRIEVTSIGHLLLTVVAAAIMGCEAPLVLDRVETALEQPVRRSDRFQAAVDNGDVLVAVGSYGVILTSVDDGQTWARHQVDGQLSLIDAATCADGSIVALAIEGYILSSTDDGQSWIRRKTASDETPLALTCDPGGTVWVVGSFASIISTTDLGDTWRARSLDDDLLLTCVTFFDNRSGLVLGEFGSLARTDDGGASWQLLDPLPGEFYPMAAHFDNANEGWVAGLHGTILYTGDGGLTWQQTDTGTEAPIYGFARHGGEMYAVGGFGTLLRRVQTGSGGYLWQRKDIGYPVRFFLRAAVAVGDDRLLIGGGAGALHVIGTGKR